MIMIEAKLLNNSSMWKKDTHLLLSITKICKILELFLHTLIAVCKLNPSSVFLYTDYVPGVISYATVSFNFYSLFLHAFIYWYQVLGLC